MNYVHPLLWIFGVGFGCIVGYYWNKWETQDVEIATRKLKKYKDAIAELKRDKEQF